MAKAKAKPKAKPTAKTLPLITRISADFTAEAREKVVAADLRRGSRLRPEQLANGQSSNQQSALSNQPKTSY
jgi:hypothetical protein